MYPGWIQTRADLDTSLTAQASVSEQTQHLSKTQLEQFEKSLLDKYKPEVEVYAINDATGRTPTVSASGQLTFGSLFKKITTGDTGLTTTQQNFLDRATLAKAYELWIADTDVGSAGRFMSAVFWELFSRVNHRK